MIKVAKSAWPSYRQPNVARPMRGERGYDPGRKCLDVEAGVMGSFRRCRAGKFLRCRCQRSSAWLQFELGDEQRNSRFGCSEKRQIDWRKRLVIHAPAVMAILVGRTVNDCRAWRLSIAGLAQRATKINPIQTEDHIRIADHLRRCLINK